MQVFDSKTILSGIQQLLKAYAWILFIDSPYVGGIFLCLSFWQPNIGLAGLIAALTATLLVHKLKFAYRDSGVHIFNAILVGLSVGAFYLLDGSVVLLIIISAALCVFLTVMLINIFSKFGTLPVLTAPFVIVAITTAFAAKTFANISNFLPQASDYGNWLPAGLENFFTALGSILFLPYPLVGAVIFAGIFWRSRYLAFLCIGGFLVGFQVYQHFTAAEYASLAIYNGFNFSLTAMALGAIYVVPGISSFTIALAGAAMAAVVASAAQSFMALYNLPVMATPFILTTLTLLSALNTRQSLSPPWLQLSNPDLPEKHYERARIAKYRIGSMHSVPLVAPFFGTWHIYQGFNGKHTHQPPWQHALDFIMLEDKKSFRSEGKYLEDYYCYGLPVKSPVYGTVARTYDKLPDNIPGEVDLKNNWGNFILIRLETGLFVLLAHLKQNSITVKENEHVEPGKVLASCGNSGRSPQPHLHLQVQNTAVLGSPTFPFHLTSINVKSKNNLSEFKLVAIPEEEDAVTPLEADAALALAMHLPVGRSLCYEYHAPKAKPKQRKLQVTLSLYGEFRLVSDSGASAAFLESNGMLAFYDRRGPHDHFFDMFLLALGLTPFSASVTNWQDSPSAHLLPATPLQKIILATFYPLGTGLHSQYTRNKDEENAHWQQNGKHSLQLGMTKIQLNTAAIISRRGCEQLELNMDKKHWSATLLNVDQEEDIGIHFD
ncbi:MAG: urea transporter [Gammaproteobacteria bacterium]|nr:urea transporter [Gammaproteobacteria bacterium]